jgi:amino acid transporter
MAAEFIILITLLSGRSASLTLKLQIPIFILVCLSIFALVFGVLSAEKQAPILEPSYTTAEGGFWYVFAVFFPAVTGFTAGIGMSGDLLSPRRSIPRGTLAAVISGAIIYMLIPVVLSITALLTIEQLTDLNYGLKSWTNVALVGGILVIPAVWGALLSSAFGSILGGPRALQALSMDGLAPTRLSRLSKTGEPTIATWVTGAFALLAVLLGDLNTIAQFVSVLFLSLYVTINASAAVEDFVNEPSYKPTLRVPWFVSIIGVFGAIGVMFLISPVAYLFAVILISTIYYWLKSRSLEQKWRDVAVGFWTNVTRYGLAKLENQKFFGRNWRPLILAFVRDIDKRLELINLVSLLGQNHGILTIAYLEEGKSILPIEEKMNKEKHMSERLAKNGFYAFCEVYPAETFNQGVREVTKAHGIAKLKTNTVAFGLSDDPDDLLEQVHCLPQIAELGKNLLVFDCKTPLPKEGQLVDIWWGGRENNGDLMLILAYLLKINFSWSNARIRILSLVRDEQSQRKLELGIRELLPSIRIRAEVIVIVSNEELYSVLKDSSSNSDLVFLGIPRIKEATRRRLPPILSK